jgi:hypothetical protein
MTVVGPLLDDIPEPLTKDGRERLRGRLRVRRSWSFVRYLAADGLLAGFSCAMLGAARCRGDASSRGDVLEFVSFER